AADAFVLPIVIGLGYRSLSVPVTALPLVREVLRRIDSVQARAVASKALECATADEVAWLVATHFGRELGELWTEPASKRHPEAPHARQADISASLATRDKLHTGRSP